MGVRKRVVCRLCGCSDFVFVDRLDTVRDFCLSRVLESDSSYVLFHSSRECVGVRFCSSCSFAERVGVLD